jgi:hypothetical protein
MARAMRGPRKPAPLPQASEAYAAIEPELDRVPQDELKPISVDIPYAVSVVLGLLEGLRELRQQIVEQLPRFQLSFVDKLEQYALAAWYAHVMAQPATPPERPVRKLLEEATKLRAALLSDAEALARRELVPAETVADIRAGSGNYDTANDLVALYALFTAAWVDVEGRTAATLEEIRRAGALGTELLAALGQEEKGRLASPEAVERRKRAFTLFLKAYDETRRAVCYLRWNEGDADEIAPSIYKGRGSRPTAQTETRPPAPAEPVPTAPVPETPAT